MNQFVDGVLLLVTAPRNVSFLVAEKSFNKAVIGDFCKAVGSIPVSRPQDKAKLGPGLICIEGFTVHGDGTEFTALEPGDRIRPENSSESFKFNKERMTDVSGCMEEEPGSTFGTERRGRSKSHPPPEENEDAPLRKWLRYDILKPVDQASMFDQVHKALAEGRSIGIFPEGGSHDNTDLLPLKAGVAAIALGVLDKYDINVPIVPVGLNYFRGHHFRGRAVVEYGAPMTITKDVVQMYKKSKRLAYTELLTNIADGMRSVIVPAFDYSELKLIHTTRRLYQRPSSKEGSTKEKQDLARRFSAAYKILKERYDEDGFPQDIQVLIEKLEVYQNILDKWGLRDYQLIGDSLEVACSSYSKLLYSFVHGAIVLSLASIPSLVLNAPVGFAANYWAYREAKKDLKASRVKIQARDVLLSKKIVFSIVAVPALWIAYALILWFLTPLEKQTVVMIFLMMPVFSYIGVMAVTAGIVDIKDLRPAYLRLFPAFRQEVKRLPSMRLELQREVRAIVRKYGPPLGILYYAKDNTWEHHAKLSRSKSEGLALSQKEEVAKGKE